MKSLSVELPSNRKFGFFFAFIFVIAALYFYIISSTTFTYMFLALAIIFVTITLFAADVLLPFNKIWMNFGLLLGMIVSPFIMGIIFFGIFTPVGFVIRLVGRDELRLAPRELKTYWILCETETRAESFKDQF